MTEFEKWETKAKLIGIYEDYVIDNDTCTLYGIAKHRQNSLSLALSKGSTVLGVDRISGIKRIQDAIDRNCYGDFQSLDIEKMKAANVPVRAITGHMLYYAFGDNKITDVIDTSIIKLNNYTIALGDSAFKESDITEVKLDKRIKQLDKEAFSDNHITKLDLGEVESIGIKAFANNKELESVVIPQSVKYIAGGAFYGCKALKEVIFTSRDIVISGSAFDLTPWIKELAKKQECLATVPRIHKIFSQRQFFVPAEIEVLSEAASRNNRKLEYVNFNKSEVIDIPENCFRSDNKLSFIVLSHKIKNIGFMSFFSCSNLEKIVIPEGVERIEALAFARCKNLKEVKLPSTLKIIEPLAFAGSALTSLSIPKGVEYIYSDIVLGGEYVCNVAVPTDTKVIESPFWHTWYSPSNNRDDYENWIDVRMNKGDYLESFNKQSLHNKEYAIELDNKNTNLLRKVFYDSNKNNFVEKLKETNDYVAGKLTRY